MAKTPKLSPLDPNSKAPWWHITKPCTCPMGLGPKMIYTKFHPNPLHRWARAFGPGGASIFGQGWAGVGRIVRPGKGGTLPSWTRFPVVAILRESGDFARKWRFCAKVAILCKSGDLEGPRGTRISWRFIFTTQKVAILKSCGDLPVPWLLLP